MTPYSYSNQSARLTTSPKFNEVIQTDLHNDIDQTQFINESYPQSKHILDLSNRGLTNQQLEKELNKVDPLSIYVLDISNNKLTGKVDLNRFGNLNFLDCSNNQIEQLKIVTEALVRLNCSNNRLSSLEVSNVIYLPDEELEFINDLDFDPATIGIRNNFSNQKVYIEAEKTEWTFGLEEILPNANPNFMHNFKDATKLSGDDAINASGNQFSYQYKVVPIEESLNDPEYSLDVTVYINRHGGSSIKNPTINIPEEIGQGTIGKQDESTKHQSIYRLYNPNSGEHFYTTSTKEKNHLVQVGWRYEGIGWIAPELSMQPVYRLYNPNAGDHHYTTSVEERNALQIVGWKYEQISFYSDEFKTIPLYRQYNPNAISGAHNYTTDKHENDTLISLGWKAEDIAWYALEK